MKTLFKEYIDFYFEYKKTELKSSSLHKYKGILNNYIYPYFGNLSPKEANNIHNIRKFLLNIHNQSIKGELSSKFIKDIVSVLRGCLDEAFYDEAIEKNNIDLLRAIKSQKPEINPFSAKEVKKLLKYSKGWFRVYLFVAFYTGMRTGEILALELKDIDLRSNIISITKTRGKFGVTKPKNLYSIRDIPIFLPLKNVLLEYTKTCDTQYLFVNQFNKPFNTASNITKRHFNPLLKKLRLKKRRLYETRHTFATNMLDSGKFKVNEISKMLGHANSQMIFNRYTKFIESEKKKNNTLVDVYF